MTRILLIDEEVDVRLFHRVLLEELDGYEVIEAGSGAAAKEVLALQNVDVIVVDFQVQDIRGPQFVSELRARRPDLPIIIDSGNNRFCEYFQNLEAHAVVYKSSGFPDLENALIHAVAIQ